MENANYVMNILYAKYGGLVSEDLFGTGAEWATGLITSMERHLNSFRTHDPSYPEVHIGIISNSQVNACVTSYESKCYIGIFVGTIFSVENVFMRMLASPNLFSSVGDVNVEIAQEKVFDLRIPNFETIVDVMGMIVTPEDPERAMFAYSLRNMALTYLIFHEYGHFVLGHSDFSNYFAGIASYMEFKADGDEEASMHPIFMQVCERDADMYATAKALEALERYCRNENPEIRKMFPNIKEAVRLWSFSIYSYWKLSGGNLPRSFVLGKATHPSQETRQFIAIQSLGNYFAASFQGTANWLERSKELIEIAMKGFEEAELAYEEVSEQPYVGIEMLRNEIREYITILDKHMEQVRRAVKPYSLVSPLKD
jgi:hypothetical protein